MEQNTCYNAVAKGHPVDAIDKDAVADNNFYEDTLVAKSGDLSMLEYEDGTTTFDIWNGELQQQLEIHDVSKQTIIYSSRYATTLTKGSTTIMTALSESTGLTPLSPPPPPPLANDDEADSQDLRQFTQNASGMNTTTRVLSFALPHLASTVTARESHIHMYSNVDRFRRIEKHIASLRSVTRAKTSNPVANSPSTKSVRPVFRRATAGILDASSVVLPPCLEPFSLTFDVGLVLVLRLQQTQRQMKEYIQATTMSNPAELGGGSIVTATSNLLEGVKDKCDTTKVNATKRKTSKVSQATYYNFQKEIKTQSTVIAASREENGRLKQQLKQVRQDDRYNVSEAIERLRLQMKMLRDKVSETGTLGGNSGLTSKPQYRVAVKARSEEKTCALASQKDLVTTQLSYQQKLNEVVLELDRVKKDKIELECCYEGVDLTQAAQEMKHAFEPQGELELSELELCEKERAHALVALQKSLSWYLEKQRLLDDQNEELRRLRRQAAPQSLDFQTGTSSMNQRANAEPCGPYSNLPLLPLSIDIRRIQRVDGRLAELGEAMRWRHPDTFSNLSLASRRINDESKTLVLHGDYDVKFTAQSCDPEQSTRSK
ncbi:unnamed protein product [Peronospora farinosa]|uniref:Centrosomal protein of 162 kDa n=1 Tax=Peronospora farinosa TaxID=134698 RepID=A0ABN8CIS3_9STRA|nr:unnamed protein product [Peronospora farinosa]